VLHAPRQTGKTTFLQSWMREINTGGGGAAAPVACYVSVERCEGMPEVEKAMPNIGEAVREWARRYGLPVPEPANGNPGSALGSVMQNWASLVAPKPLAVLFDEVDVLSGPALVSFLRQLRDGFAGRGAGKFPVSIALVGMRDLKDYITATKDRIPVNPGSPFNVKEDSAVLSNFRKEDITRLFAQRTEETGQRITPDALDYVWEQSRGQPWIVNSLFKRAVMRVLAEDSTETVTKEHIDAARRQMILARETLLDALAYRLEDPAIRKVMETLLTGAVDLNLPDGEAFRVCLDLGLVTIEHGTPTVANPMYREVLARQMTWGSQLAVPAPEFRWQTTDGELDMDALLKEFQRFWRENSEVWETQSNYPEAFPHLLLMGFLQRVLNGGGRIEREYAAGRGRLDLLVEYGKTRFIIEIKIVHSYETPEKVLGKGLEQIAKYRDTIDRGAPSYLVIFDRRGSGLSWDRRITWAESDRVTVVGC
jgi:hypothetical protein